jgi:hypothetical protein
MPPRGTGVRPKQPNTPAAPACPMDVVASVSDCRTIVYQNGLKVNSQFRGCYKGCPVECRQPGIRCFWGVVVAQRWKEAAKGGRSRNGGAGPNGLAPPGSLGKTSPRRESGRCVAGSGRWGPEQRNGVCRPVTAGTPRFPRQSHSTRQRRRCQEAISRPAGGPGVWRACWGSLFPHTSPRPTRQRTPGVQRCPR